MVDPPLTMHCQLRILNQLIGSIFWSMLAIEMQQ